MANPNHYTSTFIDWEKLSNNILTTRTPLRIGFVGGGTDISDYWRYYGGEDNQDPIETSKRDIVPKTLLFQ